MPLLLLALLFGTGRAIPPTGCIGEGQILLAFGDSKSVPKWAPATSNNEEIWEDFLERKGCSGKFNVGTGYSTHTSEWYKPGIIADNGITTAQRATTVVDDLAAVTRAPDAILYNLGSNDAFFGDAEAGDEAAWKANLTTIWDAMHAAFPDARIHYSNTWRAGGYESEFNRLAQWYADVAAGRSYVSLCDDERVWGKSTDGGATMFHDGVHFSRSGAAEKARLAAACLGY